MRYWVDRSSESNNVIIANDMSVAIGSCDKDHYDSVEEQLTEGKTAAEVLGTDDLKIIPFSQVQNLVSRNTDRDVDVTYKAKKETLLVTLDFDSEKEAQEFIDYIAPNLPETLKKSEVQQSFISASLMPIVSIAVACLIGFFYFNKARFIVYIVAGLWIAGSLLVLYQRVTNPPLVTRWTVKGKLARKTWSGMKTAWSYALAALVAFGISTQLPDRHGEKALLDLARDDALVAENVQTYVARGADLNYPDSDGDAALWWTITNSDDESSLALIEAGANVAMHEGYLLEHAYYYDAGESVLKAMFERGVLDVAEASGNIDAEYYLSEDGDAFSDMIRQYRKVETVVMAED